ncbi:hypothetical protein ABBQ38_007745 [Trebouxia sp. C0009 RCD-2024]
MWEGVTEKGGSLPGDEPPRNPKSCICCSRTHPTCRSKQCMWCGTSVHNVPPLNYYEYIVSWPMHGMCLGLCNCNVLMHHMRGQVHTNEPSRVTQAQAHAQLELSASLTEHN